MSTAALRLWSDLMTKFNPPTSALIFVDLQNDFIHPDGAYGRAGVATIE